uniref:C2 domain-containing protein n=1 Tax=Plectus sambesii TaxID=2011161 RepID=A0A914WKM1_9BILA
MRPKPGDLQESRVANDLQSFLLRSLHRPYHINALRRRRRNEAIVVARSALIGRTQPARCLLRFRLSASPLTTASWRPPSINLVPPFVLRTAAGWSAIVGRPLGCRLHNHQVSFIAAVRWDCQLSLDTLGFIDNMELLVPVYGLVLAGTLMTVVIALLGVALMRTKKGSYKPGLRQNLPPPIIYGTNLQAVQPGSGVPKSRFNFFRKSTPQFIDPQTSEAKDYLGKVNFSVSYEKDSHTMNVLILEAVDLPAKDLTGSSDPYVRVCLLPDTGVYQRTKVHRRNLNPKFQQTLSFPGNVSRT